MVNPGYAEHPGDSDPPGFPHSPDIPRYFPGRPISMHPVIMAPAGSAFGSCRPLAWSATRGKQGVNVHDEVTGQGGRPEGGSNGPAEAGVTSVRQARTRDVMIVKTFLRFWAGRSLRDHGKSRGKARSPRSRERERDRKASAASLSSRADLAYRRVISRRALTGPLSQRSGFFPHRSRPPVKKHDRRDRRDHGTCKPSRAAGGSPPAPHSGSRL